MEVRDLWPESIKTVGAMKDNLFIRYFEREEKWCYNSALAIVSVTESFKTEIIKRGINPNKIKVIRSGANHDIFQPQAKNQDIINNLGLNGKRVLGYIGTHGMAHKLDFILDCAKELNQFDNSFHFILIGDGAEKNNLRKKIEVEKISNVTMLNTVPKSEVVKYLSILDAAIINLKKDNLFKTVIPSKIYETAAMQIPILIGVDGEARMLVEQYSAGLYYEPENMESFIKALYYLFNSEGVYKKYKEGGQNLSKEYDRKILAREMLTFLYSILK
jgi:glycosyltransferase involved in cell wall biosynthesis